MVTHSSILAWKILWTEEWGGLQSIGLQRVYCEERPHDGISALNGRGRETRGLLSLPHEDTFEPGREFSAQPEHAIPWSQALEFWEVTVGCLSHSIHNILLQQPRLTRTWLPRLGQCHSTSPWLCTLFRMWYDIWLSWSCHAGKTCGQNTWKQRHAWGAPAVSAPAVEVFPTQVLDLWMSEPSGVLIPACELPPLSPSGTEMTLPYQARLKYQTH